MDAAIEALGDLLEKLALSPILISGLLLALTFLQWYNAWRMRVAERNAALSKEIQENIPKLQGSIEAMAETVAENDGLKEGHIERDMMRLARRTANLAQPFMKKDRRLDYLSGADYGSLSHVLATLRDPLADDFFKHSMKVSKTTFFKLINSRIFMRSAYIGGAPDHAREIQALSHGYLDAMQRELDASKQPPQAREIFGAPLPLQLKIGPYERSLARPQPEENALIDENFIRHHRGLHHLFVFHGELLSQADAPTLARELATAVRHFKGNDAPMLRLEAHRHLLTICGIFFGLPFYAYREKQAVYATTMINSGALGYFLNHPLDYCDTPHLDAAADGAQNAAAAYLDEVTAAFGAAADAEQTQRASKNQEAAEQHMEAVLRDARARAAGELEAHAHFAAHAAAAERQAAEGDAHQP